MNTDEEDVFANIYMDDSGVYLVNYKGYPYVKCADGKSGREILNNILDVLSDLPNTEGIKYGKMRMDTTPFPWELDIPVGILIFRLDFLLTKSRQARVALTSMDMVMELRSK